MADAEWENEDFEPAPFVKPVLHTDRWEGEDEDDNIKDNWDDEEVEKEEKDEQTIVAVQSKKKKSIAVIIAEKEEKKRKEIEEKMKLLELQQPEKKELTAEEKIAYKLKQQKLQEESDLQLAKETFGVAETTDVLGLDTIRPTSKEDFDNFRKLLVEKICKSEESPHFLLFLEDLCRDLCINVQSEDIKKITSSLNALAFEKAKALKAKQKKKPKKATLKIGKADLSIIDYGDEFEDCI